MSEIDDEEIDYHKCFEEGVCPICESELKKWIDKVPYGDTYVDMATMYCPNNCI